MEYFMSKPLRVRICVSTLKGLMYISPRIRGVNLSAASNITSLKDNIELINNKNPVICVTLLQQ